MILPLPWSLCMFEHTVQVSKHFTRFSLSCAYLTKRFAASDDHANPSEISRGPLEISPQVCLFVAYRCAVRMEDSRPLMNLMTTIERHGLNPKVVLLRVTRLDRVSLRVESS